MPSNLIGLQAPGGALTSSTLRRITDPISILPSTSSQMRHFFEGIYDLSPESHLTRFTKALLGDSGVGYLHKIYIYAKQQSVLATMRYADLDAFYGAVLDIERFSWERTDPARYFQANTPDEWDEIDARDAGYRARIDAFSRSIALGATPSGIVGIAEALLGTECRLYESYLMIDEGGQDTPPDLPVGVRTYGKVEEDFDRYADMENLTYADIEGGVGTIGRSDVNDRSHFTIRPMRQISLEERYQVTKVLERFKPVGSLLSLNPEGVALHSLAKIRGVHSESVHWEVIPRAYPVPTNGNLYDPEGSDDPDMHNEPYGDGYDLRRPAMSGYQGEVWSYNGDVVRVRGYREIAEGLWPILPDPTDYEQRITPPPGFQPHGYTRGLHESWERVHYKSGPREYHPAKGLADHITLMMGRNASDGVATSSPIITEQTAAEQLRPQPIPPALNKPIAPPSAKRPSPVAPPSVRNPGPPRFTNPVVM